QVDDVPVLVGEDLELDMMRPLDVLLEEDLAVPERREGLPSGHLHFVEQLLVVADHVQPAPAASHGRLDHQGITRPRGEAERLRRLHEEGGGVALRVDRDGPDPELPARADDAHGDLAAVGDEDSLKHSPSESATGYHSARGQVEGLAEGCDGFSRAGGTCGRGRAPSGDWPW